MDKNNIKKQNVYISEEEKTLHWQEIQISFRSSELDKETLGYIQNIARMFNINIKKPGKIKPINKFKNELIDDIKSL